MFDRNDRFQSKQVHFKALTVLQIFMEIICGTPKQNESEVGSDMLLVSDYFFHFNHRLTESETTHM